MKKNGQKILTIRYPVFFEKIETKKNFFVIIKTTNTIFLAAELPWRFI